MTNVPDFIPDDIRLDAVVQRRIELLMHEAELLERLAGFRRELAEILLDSPRAILSAKGRQMVSNFEEQMAALDALDGAM